MLPEKIGLDKLLDALTEHQPDDPGFGPPESWPEWTDGMIAQDGAPMSSFEEFEPTREDWDDYNDWCERLEYERSCNARFAP